MNALRMDDLRSTLVEMLTAPHLDPSVKTVHLSHNDLDGYGCTITTNLGEYIYNNYAFYLDQRILRYNTGKIGDELYPEIMQIIMDTVRYSPECKTLNLLITDLGGLQVDKLFDLRLSDGYPAGVNVRVFVIDHHKSIYDSGYPGETYRQNSEDEYWFHDAVRSSLMGNMMVIYYSNQYRSAALSTTVLMYDIDIPQAYTDLMSAISDYDTGKWKNDWITMPTITTDGSLFSDIERQLSSEIILCDPILLQAMFTATYNPVGIDKHSRFIQLCTSVLIHQTVIPDIIIGMVYNTVHGMQTGYEAFCKRIVEIAPALTEDGKVVLGGSDELLTGPLTMTIPEHLRDNLPIIRVVIDTDEIHYPFSMYAKAYLEENNYPILVRITPKDVNLRSTDSYSYCYDIAKANGGGGHARAAGFPIPKDLLKR